MAEFTAGVTAKQPAAAIDETGFGVGKRLESDRGATGPRLRSIRD